MKGLGSNRAVLGAAAIIAAHLFAHSTVFGLGHYTRIGLAFVTLGFLLALLAALWVRRLPASNTDKFLGVLAVAALVVQVVYLLQLHPAMYGDPHHAPAELLAVRLLLAGATFATIVSLRFDRPRLSLLRWGLFLAAFALGAHWTFQASPQPFIDVWYLNQEASRRLLHLENPYGLVIPHLYDPSQVDAFYPYPPITVLVQAPFYFLFGDTRLAYVVAMPAMAFAITLLARQSGLRGATADALGAFALFSPRVFYILEQAWTDPIGAAFIAWGVWAWHGGRLTTATILLGLGAFAKQYLLVLFPILFFLPYFGRRRALAAFGVAFVTVLPFLLWNPERFWWGVFGYHLAVAPRIDAVSLNAFFLRHGQTLTPWIGVALWAGLGAGLAWKRRLEPSAAWVILPTALAALFVFGKVAFANYYWLAAVLLVVAAAQLARPGPAAHEPERGTTVL